MTSHGSSQPNTPSATAPAAVLPNPNDEGRAGRLSLRLADIAARHGKLSALADEVAKYLREELGADSTILYWCRHKERRRGGTGTLLAPVGAAYAATDTQAVEQTVRRLKTSGYRALSKGALDARVPADPPTDRDDSSSVTIAVPIGTNAHWAVLVAAWTKLSKDAAADLTSFLEAIRSTLTLVTRPAHVLDEASHADALHSPRRAVFAVTSEAIVTLDNEFIIHEINPAFTNILGWPAQAAVGRRCSDLLRCRDERRILLCETPRCPLREAFDASVATPVRELSWETQAGRPSEVSASFTVQRVEHHAEAVIVARDVTLLNAANRMRANFISMVSHELRTPLNSINGFLEIVLESPVGPLNERQREFLNYARVSTQQLTTLVEDILFISKADSGQFTLRVARMRVPKVVDSAVQAVQSAAEKAQVRVVTDLSPRLPVIHADELRIQQVLTNLLGNAVKFSPPEGAVHLTVRINEAEVQFAVRDEGKGIAPEDHTRIFERFYQSDSNVRTRAGGYGLGLSIAKLIVEQHHGRIWVESEPGAGATFYFTLPLDAS